MVIEKITAQTKGFTLSPKPRNVKYNQWLLFNWWRKIHEVLTSFSSNYDIYPEFDDSGRLHFHGIFECKDKIKFYRTQNRLKKYGFVKYEGHITDKWLTYCRKDLSTTLGVFDCDCNSYIPMLKEDYAKLRNELRIDYLNSEREEALKKYLFLFDQEDPLEHSVA